MVVLPVITLALTGSNLLSVKNYGEFEFWLALCKVIAILAFIVLGAVAITGFYPYAEVSGISRLWDHGGFMPNGFGAVLSAMLITMFSFMGAEIVTIAAAESDTPDKHIVRATNSVIWRISIFYLCSIFIVVALIPWNMPGLKSIGSYRSVLELLHIPYAKLIMDGVILLSVTSCLNSALYTASRMLYSLSRRGDAPAIMGRTNRSKTPYVAVLLSTGAAFLTVVVNYYAPAKVFKFLIDSSGAIALLVYLVIAVSQLRMRKILQAQGGEIRLRMWLYPYLTAGDRLYHLRAGGDAVPSGTAAGGDLYRPVSSGNYLYGTDYVTLEKAGIVAKTAAAKYALTLFPAPAGKSIQE